MDISPLTGVWFVGCKIIHLGGSSSATTQDNAVGRFCCALLMKRIIPDHWDLIIQSTPNCISPRLSHSSGGGFLFGRVNLTGDKDDLSCLISSHLAVSPQVMLFLSAVVSSWIHHLTNIQRKKRINNSDPPLCVFPIILLPLFI